MQTNLTWLSGTFTHYLHLLFCTLSELDKGASSTPQTTPKDAFHSPSTLPVRLSLQMQALIAFSGPDVPIARTTKIMNISIINSRSFAQGPSARREPTSWSSEPPLLLFGPSARHAGGGLGQDGDRYARE